ncbi:MAG: DUF4437 domain-containing protein [Actinomycetia bacterium]|nr:DUF4437 domain-containing protein [Actinomycetes bacterium]
MADHTSREQPQLYNVHELEWQPHSEVPALAGVSARLLSKDADGASMTVMAKLPAGWRAVEHADEATVELFVLEGGLAVNGEEVGAGGYVYLPRQTGSAELRSAGGAQVVAFWNAQLDAIHGTEIALRRVWQEPWIASSMPGALHGAMHKSLRLPDVGDGKIHGGPGGLVRLVILTPGFLDDREHVHSVWEEMLFLGGDLLMPNRGVIAPGSYLGNPAEHWHAPMITQRSSIMLLQTTAPIDQVPREFPWGREMAERYLDSESWLGEPAHQPWDTIPHYHPPVPA